MAVDDVPLGIRLFLGRGGEAEVTPDEMRYLNTLTDEDMVEIQRHACNRLGLAWFPPHPSETTRVKVVR